MPRIKAIWTTITGWLEPLLGRIAEGKHHVVCPVIDNIADDTLRYYAHPSLNISVGKFDWDLIFKWMTIPKNLDSHRSSKIEPARFVAVT